MKLRWLLLLTCTAVLMAGCKKEPAGFQIDGGGHALTVERKKPYFWSDGWELDLIVTRQPDCQRRHALQKAGERVRVDLYAAQPGVFILNQGRHWYVADTHDCRMQQFEDAPPEPGELIGTFRVKDNAFVFVPVADDKSGKGE